MKTLMSMFLWCCCAITLVAQEGKSGADTVSSNDSNAVTAGFRRADRAHGFKIGFAARTTTSNLGFQADMIVLNRVGLEVATTLATSSARIRYYVLEGPSSPYLGIGTGMEFYSEGTSTGSWKEWHAGFEHAFSSGIVVQIQLLGFFDERRIVMGDYTLAPGIGYRL